MASKMGKKGDMSIEKIFEILLGVVAIGLVIYILVGLATEGSGVLKSMFGKTGP
jgi:uncharacterized protein (UPF0333 family)